MVTDRIGGIVRAASFTIVALCIAALIDQAVAAAAPANGDTPQAIIDRVLPGASTSLQAASRNTTAIPGRPKTSTAPPPPGMTLKITLADSTAPPSGTDTVQRFAYADLQWRAELGSAVAALGDSAVTGFSLQYSGGIVPGGAAGYFRDEVGADGPGAHDPSIDTLSQSDALRQATSNVATFAKALPVGAVTSSSAKIVPIAPDANQFGVSIAIVLSDPSQLTGHLGDVLKGMETGLVSPSDVMVEGIAITVSANGQPLLGTWESIRGGTGDIEADPSIPLGDSLSTDLDFPNYTGLPNPGASVVGGPALPRRSSTTKQQGAASPAQAVGETRQAGPARKNSSPWPYAGTGIGAAAFVTTIALIIRRRRRRPNTA